MSGRETADAARVIATARRWLGTPYHNQAALRGAGCDCLGLARGIWADMGGAPVRSVPVYTRDWGEAGTRERLAEGLRAYLIEIDPAKAGAGALVVFRMADRAIAKHVGILTDAGSFIHSYERLGVIEEPLTKAWQRRIAFAFEFPRIDART
ncbi:NlpC/P60 family protein [Roseinatronobacter sp.]